MIEGIYPIEIEASDANEMTDFLRGLGFVQLRETEHHGVPYEVKSKDADSPIIEIHTVKGEETSGINHPASQVADIEQAPATLKQEDFGSVSNPYYVEQTGRTIINLREPDGRRFQLVSDDAATGAENKQWSLSVETLQFTECCGRQRLIKLRQARGPTESDGNILMSAKNPSTPVLTSIEAVTAINFGHCGNLQRCEQLTEYDHYRETNKTFLNVPYSISWKTQIYY